MNSLQESFFRQTEGQALYFWEGPYAPINFSFGWTNSRYYRDLYQTPALVGLHVIKGRDAHILFSETYYRGYAREIFKDYWTGQNRAEKFEREALKIDDTVRTWYETTILRDFTALSEDELIHTVLKGREYFGMILPYTIYTETFDKEVALDVMGTFGSGVVDAVWEEASQPHFESFEKRRLRHALSLLGKENADKLFWYAGTDYFSPISIDAARQAFEGIEDTQEAKLVELEYDDSVRAQQVKTYVTWLETLPPEAKKLAQFVQSAMYTRDWRKDTLARMQTVWSVATQELLRRASIDTWLAPYVIQGDLEEGVSVLSEKRGDIEQRPQGCIILTENDTVISEVGEMHDIIVELEQHHLMQEKGGDSIRELRGQVGARGVVCGRVCVVRDANRADMFKHGDILVTGMTRPEFVLLMKMAAGIITDEGGITCHAAIVSRELKKPCIIGTKLATKLLHDGDLVEVDADKGVVKIVERAPIN